MKLEMNICSRSFLRGGILETVGGLALERLTRNQKPIPHLSVFMVIKVGYKYNFTLFSKLFLETLWPFEGGGGKKEWSRIERSKEN